jgi:hypothetical protein
MMDVLLMTNTIQKTEGKFRADASVAYRSKDSRLIGLQHFEQTLSKCGACTTRYEHRRSSRLPLAAMVYTDRGLNKTPQRPAQSGLCTTMLIILNKSAIF